MAHRVVNKTMMHPTQPTTAVCASCSRKMLSQLLPSRYVALLYYRLYYSRSFLQMTAGWKNPIKGMSYMYLFILYSTITS